MTTLLNVLPAAGIGVMLAPGAIGAGQHRLHQNLGGGYGNQFVRSYSAGDSERLIQAVFSFLSLWRLFCRHPGKMKLYQQICAIKPAGAGQRV